MHVISNLDLSEFGYTWHDGSCRYYSRPGQDTSPIDVASIEIDQNSTDCGPVALVFFDGHLIFRTLTEGESSDDPLGLNGRTLITQYEDRCEASVFLAFTDTIGYTSGAYEEFIDDNNTTISGMIEDHAEEEGLNGFSRFIEIVTKAVRSND